MSSKHESEADHDCSASYSVEGFETVHVNAYDDFAAESGEPSTVRSSPEHPPLPPPPIPTHGEVAPHPPKDNAQQLHTSDEQVNAYDDSDSEGGVPSPVGSSPVRHKLPPAAPAQREVQHPLKERIVQLRTSNEQLRQQLATLSKQLEQTREMVRRGSLRKETSYAYDPVRDAQLSSVLEQGEQLRQANEALRQQLQKLHPDTLIALTQQLRQRTTELQSMEKFRMDLLRSQRINDKHLKVLEEKPRVMDKDRFFIEVRDEKGQNEKKILEMRRQHRMNRDQIAHWKDRVERARASVERSGVAGVDHATHKTLVDQERQNESEIEALQRKIYALPATTESVERNYVRVAREKRQEATLLTEKIHQLEEMVRLKESQIRANNHIYLLHPPVPARPPHYVAPMEPAQPLAPSPPKVDPSRSKARAAANVLAMIENESRKLHEISNERADHKTAASLAKDPSYDSSLNSLDD